MTTDTPLPIATLKKEIVAVASIQFVLVIALVHSARFFGFEGALSALVGALFVFLPVWVLDRRGKPYARYGMSIKNPIREMPTVLLFAAVTWPPVVAAIFLFPELWLLHHVSWRFVFPDGYISTLIAHFLVVALPEEFFFRGYLLSRLDDVFTRRKTILGVQVGHGLWISALVFAVGHFAVDLHPSRLLVFFPALAFGYLRIKRKTIVAPIIFHGLCNVFMDLFRAGLGLE